MEIKSDIEIAQSCQAKNIRDIAAVAGVDEKCLEMDGNDKAKVDYKLLNETQHEDGKLILVTAITTTPAGEGGKAQAEEVVRRCQEDNHFQYVYDNQCSIEEKLDAIVKKVYHGDGVVLTPNAKKQAKELADLGFGNLPICMAKTQYSFSDEASLLGAPKGFAVTVRNLKVSAGAGFLVALTGDIMTMPELPKVSSAEKIDVDENGRITGLF